MVLLPAGSRIRPRVLGSLDVLLMFTGDVLGQLRAIFIQQGLVYYNTVTSSCGGHCYAFVASSSQAIAGLPHRIPRPDASNSPSDLEQLGHKV